MDTDDTRSTSDKLASSIEGGVRGEKARVHPVDGWLVDGFIRKSFVTPNPYNPLNLSSGFRPSSLIANLPPQ